MICFSRDLTSYAGWSAPMHNRDSHKPHQKLKLVKQAFQLIIRLTVVYKLITIFSSTVLYCTL